ncbi:MAG: DUF1439 domain-containing protein, partial [Burkholderiales bacterium]|nr:DUF1439 domain-containing protein [Burkholderiales bacterium]
EGELQAQLARRFPLQRSLLDVYELQLSDPRLRIDGAAGRLATELALQASDKRSGRMLQGRLALDYGLRWEASDASIRLVQPRVDSLQIAPESGLSPRRAELLQRMGSALVARLLDDLALYRVPEARLQAWRSAGFQPGGLQITPDGVEITIERVAGSSSAQP